MLSAPLRINGHAHVSKRKFSGVPFNLEVDLHPGGSLIDHGDNFIASHSGNGLSSDGHIGQRTRRVVHCVSDSHCNQRNEEKPKRDAKDQRLARSGRSMFSHRPYPTDFTLFLR